MTTADIARHLEEAAKTLPLLGELTAREILETVRLELGHEEALDGFREYAGHMSRAHGPKTILHIVSGNTPHAALQSLMRGLVLASRNLVKLPSAGIPEVGQFIAALPPELNRTIEIRHDLPESWLAESDAWIVYGSDETIAHFKKRVPADTRFLAHGHRVSFGVIQNDTGFESVPLAARDVSLFDQKGCMSPHLLYVSHSPREYAERLAREMERFNRRFPRGKLTAGEAVAIMDMRAGYQFRAASDLRVAIWQSENSTDWTVVFEDDPWFASSCLNRFVFVKPLPDDLGASLLPVSRWLGGIGLWPASPEQAEAVSNLGASRLCPIGRMQDTPFSWHQEGRQFIAPLVRWVDFQP